MHSFSKSQPAVTCHLLSRVRFAFDVNVSSSLFLLLLLLNATELAPFEISKFSFVASLRGQKQRNVKIIFHFIVIRFYCFCLLSLATKLNFDISKAANYQPRSQGLSSSRPFKPFKRDRRDPGLGCSCVFQTTLRE